MPRWLVASFFAFMLSWFGFGFAAAAHASSGEVRLAGDCQPTAASIQADTPPTGDPAAADTGDEVADLDEPGSHFSEFLTGPGPFLVPEVAASWPPRLTPLGTPQPPIERPKRPPRGSFFLV